jgi:hypothetical protein
MTLEQWYWWSQIGLFGTAVVAAIYGYRQLEASNRYELLKLLEDAIPDDKLLRRVPQQKTSLLWGRPATLRLRNARFGVELSSLCDSIQHLGCKRPLAR